MGDEIEIIKQIVDLAKSGGRMEEQLKQRDEEAALHREMIAERDRIIEEQDKRIRELEALLESKTTAEPSNANVGGATQVVLIQQYYLLDRPKTMAYVCSLDNDHKIFANHMLSHTMADVMPKQMIDQVNEMTRLEANQTGRIADAVEKMADKPAEPAVKAEHYYGAGSNHEDHSRHMSMERESRANLLE